MIIYFVETESAEHPLFLEELEGHELRFVYGLDEVGADAEVLSTFIYSRITSKFIESHPSLRFISVRAASVENIDMKACRARGILVSWVTDYGSTTVAEHTFALILALSRKLREVMEMAQQPGRFSYEKSRGFDLLGKTLGIVGMGRIGLRVTALATAFQMRVVCYDPFRSDPTLAVSHGFEWVGFDELLATSDIVSLHIGISDQTYHIMDRDALFRCKPGALLINTARGRLIDTVALQEALDAGQIGGAGLDVLEDERVLRETASKIIGAEIVEHLRSDTPLDQAQEKTRIDDLHHLISCHALLQRPNVVFTPHVAFNTVEAVDRLNRGSAENIRAFVAGRAIHLVE